jgi:folate-binding protein YgfZ
MGTVPTLCLVDVALRRRACLRVAGPDAADYLQRMVSNDVEALAVGAACPALLLTPKARVIAPLVVLRRDDDFLVLTEPELGDAVHAHLTRMRLRAQCEIESEQHESVLLFDANGDGFTTDFPGAREALDTGLAATLSDDELEARRVAAGVPRWGRELDDRVLPAEAGLESTHISFSKGCYPGQEPVARLHYRGHPNRTLRVIRLPRVPAYDAELVHEGKVVGRVTSAVEADGGALALAYVRVEVPDDAELALA